MNLSAGVLEQFVSWRCREPLNQIVSPIYNGNYFVPVEGKGGAELKSLFVQQGPPSVPTDLSQLFLFVCFFVEWFLLFLEVKHSIICL